MTLEESGFDFLKIDFDLKQVFAIDEINKTRGVKQSQNNQRATQNKNIFGSLYLLKEIFLGNKNMTD